MWYDIVIVGPQVLSANRTGLDIQEKERPSSNTKELWRGKIETAFQMLKALPINFRQFFFYNLTTFLKTVFDLSCFCIKCLL